MLKKIIILVVLAIAAFLFFYFDLHKTLSLQQIQSRYLEFEVFYNQHPLLTPALFFITYVLVTGLSLPGAVPLTLLGGALFGLWTGAALVSFASTLGASLAFLGSRYLLKETVEKKFSSFVEPIQKGVQKNGGSYLFSLRLIPAVPFFAINLVSGLTTMPLWKFYVVSQIGMLPGTLAYVNAGTQLTQIQTLSGILSPPVIGSLLLLGLLPIVLKILLAWRKNKNIYRRFKKPAHYQYNLIAIGGGAAGLVTSYIAAAAKAKVALIEKHKMGGDCLNTGCVPSKTLIRTAKFLSDCKKSSDLGVEKVDVQVQFRDVMSRVKRVIQKIEPHDSVERYTQLGVDCLQGEAKVISPWEIEVNGKLLTTKNIVIATGARPWIPPIPGLHTVDPLTSDTLWELNELPKHFLVLGGGAIGLELAQAFLRLGSKVTLVERSSRLLEREDKEVSQWIEQKLRSEGVELLLSTQMIEFKKTEQQKVALCKTPTGEKEIFFDQVLVAVGRKANTSGFGMDTLGVELTSTGAIQTNEFMQTNFPNIYACGDVTGRMQFTHTAAQQAWFSSMNSLLRPFYQFRNDESLIPWCIYTDPEIARVGLNEISAQQKNIPYVTTFYNIDHLDRALAEESAYGFVKILTKAKSDQILGVTLVGPSAGESLAEFVLAMKYNLGLNAILKTIHSYPTLSEANKMAAGVWRKSQLSERLLKISELFNKWQRS